MGKIIRIPSRAEGGITPEEAKLMEAHTQLWIQRAMRTDPIEPDKIVPAIKALYAAAGMKEPRVVIVPSPLVMAMAGGFAAGIWYFRKNGGLSDSATDLATDSATRSATDLATDLATKQDPNWAYKIAREFVATHGDAMFLMQCATKWWRMYQGGNMWAAWDCYLTAARDILGLRLKEHEKYAAWEQCAIHGGLRVLHEEFCIVSDFPEVILKDAQNRPHCDTGPSHRWRDGWSLYHVHGVVVPEYVIERPHEITVAAIDSEANSEVRRVMIERYGAGRYLTDTGAKPVSKDECGILYRKSLPEDEDLVMVRVLNSTPEPDGVMTADEARAVFGDAVVEANIAAMWRAGRAKELMQAPRFKEYFLRVPPTMRTAREAVAWTFELSPEQYRPEFQS